MPCAQCNPCASFTRSERARAPPQATPATVSALPSAAVQIAAGQGSSYAMLVDGSVWAWGRNNKGQLGDGTRNGRLSPVRIEGYGADTAMRLPPGGAEANTMFVVAADGTAMGSGSNHKGKLGNGGTDDVVTAGAIPELGGGIVEVARGGRHTLVLKGGLASCGDADGVGPSSDAVSDADCNAVGGASYVADASASASACASTVCDIAAADGTTCCMLSESLTLTDYTALVRRAACQIHSVD